MRPPKIILRNAARCLRCDEEVESAHRHDFRRCRCGALGVDGRHDYIRRIGSFGKDMSIVVIRDVDDPAVADGLDFVDQIRAAWRPESSDYADVPLRQDWREHLIDKRPNQFRC